MNFRPFVIAPCMASLAFFALGQAAFAQTPAPVNASVLPAGTAVAVRTVATLSSATSRAGERFMIICYQDIVVNSKVVIRKGAQGRGHIVDVDGARGNGHSGFLSVAFEYIFGVDGKAITLYNVPQKFAETDRKGAASTATLVGYGALGVTGLFAHNFVPGHQQIIDARTPLDAIVDEDTRVGDPV